MNAMEKAAWTELSVSVVAVALATSLYPWLGSRATSAFALLALVVLGYAFIRPRDNRILTDERDREIAARATRLGVGTTWMTLITVLALVTTWESYSGSHAVSTGFLNWLIWIQFALFFGIRGLASVVMYRRQQHAA
jgi:hypothetical protein